MGWATQFRAAVAHSVEGLGQPQSKELEFQPMIFYGLDNQIWWSFTRAGQKN
jgi:hypothetical protein